MLSSKFHFMVLTCGKVIFIMLNLLCNRLDITILPPPGGPIAPRRCMSCNKLSDVTRKLMLITLSTNLITSLTWVSNSQALEMLAPFQKRVKQNAVCQNSASQLTDQQTIHPCIQQTNKPSTPPVNQPENYPASQQNNRPTDQKTNELNNQPTAQLTNLQNNQLTNRPTSQPADKPANVAPNQPVS